MAKDIDLEATGAIDIGERLRVLRQRKSMSLGAMATASGQEFKASTLGTYERGERTITLPRLQRLARLYGVTVQQLLLEPRPGTVSSTVSSTVSIDLNALKDIKGPEAVALQRFVATIQNEREDFQGRVLTIRHDDLRSIGRTFGRSADEIVAMLDELGLIYKS